jgi:hypothetical protein
MNMIRMFYGVAVIGDCDKLPLLGKTLSPRVKR